MKISLFPFIAVFYNQSMKDNIEGLAEIFLKMFFFLDVVISDFLSYHLIVYDNSKESDRRNELCEHFIEHITFGRKAEILIKVLEKHYPELNEAIPKNKLSYITKTRNKLAHSLLDYEKESDSKRSRINLHSFKKGEIIPDTLTYKELDKATAFCVNIFSKLDLKVKNLSENDIKLKALQLRLSQIKEQKK